MDNREIEIYDLTKKRDIFNHDDDRIRKHKSSSSTSLKEHCCNRNDIDCGLEDKINMSLHKYDIRHEVFFKENLMV